MFQDLWEIVPNKILITETPNILLFVFQPCHFFSLIWNGLSFVIIYPVTT